MPGTPGRHVFRTDRARFGNGGATVPPDRVASVRGQIRTVSGRWSNVLTVGQRECAPPLVRRDP
jgi:hypothetical protein